MRTVQNGGQSAEFVYSAEDKRVVYLRNGQETRYLYDGWNVLGEYDNANMLKKSYLWGSDLSATEQGATQQSDFRNCVGGLLACRDVSQNSVADDTGNGAGASFYYHYDGNGNVTKLTDASGNVRASYDYSPFGKVIAQSGDYANENSYRFSTKPFEKVSRCYYYGFRFYNAGVGRWMSLDAIEERGGYNFYGFNNNDNINNWDLLGLLSSVDKEVRNHAIKHTFTFFKKVPPLSIAVNRLNLSASSSDINDKLVNESSNICNSSSPYELPKGTHTTIGDVAVDLSGKFICTSKKNGITFWKFNGKVTVRTEKFDFTPLYNPRRGKAGNFLNALGFLGQLLTPIPSFDIKFPGKINLTLHGKCN